ncbi:unnamed protein product [Closterium sp. Yama58-4]|nr:unnamed protein product [Closterium sp. Yama58-4]
MAQALKLFHAARRAASRAADAGPSPLSAFRNSPSSPLLPPRFPPPCAGSPFPAKPCPSVTDQALTGGIIERSATHLRAPINESFAAAPAFPPATPPSTALRAVSAFRHFLAAPAPSPSPSLPPPPAVHSRAASTPGGNGISGATCGGGVRVRGMSGGSGGSIYVRSTREPSGLASVPLVPLVLGLAGAIPFVTLAPPICSLVPLPELLATQPAAAQAAYGAAILAFLGGPHWGLAMARYAATTSEASLGNFSVSAAQ